MSEAKVSKIRERWRRVELTDNDWVVLRYCHEQRFLTFEQACDIYGGPKRFQNFPLDTINKRLRKLAHFGLIVRQKVFTEKHSIVLLGAKGYGALCEAGRDRGLPFLATVDPRTFLHDRTMTDLRGLLVMHRLRGDWRSERVLRHVTGSQVVPDADTIWTRTGDRVAIELEQSHKNLDRYRGIFRRHLKSPYPWVLYVLTEAEHMAWLFKSALPKLEVDPCWGIDQPPIGRLRFVLLDQLKEKGADVAVWQKAPGSLQPIKHRLGDL